MYVCMIQVALAVMSMERTADWAKGRGPYMDLFSQERRVFTKFKEKLNVQCDD